MKKKIFIYTCSRADYGPLQNLISAFENSKKFETKIIVSGQHLDRSSGNTLQEIKKNHKLKILKISATLIKKSALNISILKSVIIRQFSGILQRYNPDLLIFLG